MIDRKDRQNRFFFSFVNSLTLISFCYRTEIWKEIVSNTCVEILIWNTASNKGVVKTFKFKVSLLFFSIEFLKVSSLGICITKTYFHRSITWFPLCIWMYSEMFLRALILILTCWSVFLALFHIQILNF